MSHGTNSVFLFWLPCCFYKKIVLLFLVTVCSLTSWMTCCRGMGAPQLREAVILSYLSQMVQPPKYILTETVPYMWVVFNFISSCSLFSCQISWISAQTSCFHSVFDLYTTALWPYLCRLLRNWMPVDLWMLCRIVNVSFNKNYNLYFHFV